jgi:hypothetical protein
MIGKLALGYLRVGAIFGAIMWFSFLWPVLWRPPAGMGILQQAIAILALQPIAVLSGLVRCLAWAPSLALWVFARDDQTFAMWLATGAYADLLAD